MITAFRYWYPERPKLIHPDQLGDYEGKGWIAEPKYKESRLILHVMNDSRDIYFFNRHGKQFNYNPTPELLETIRALNLEGYWCFDGGLRHGKTKGVRNKVILWDTLIQASEIQTQQPFHLRRYALESLGIPVDDGREILSRPLEFHRNFRGAFDFYLDDDEIEGLVIKCLAGKLNLGRTKANDSSWMRKARKPNNSYHF